METTSEAHDAAREAHAHLADVAHSSAAVRDQLDRAASAERRRLEIQEATLRGRIEERRQLGVAGSKNASAGSGVTTQFGAEEFTSKVLKAAHHLAESHRDTEQRQLLASVSEEITRLGKLFGFRNLEKATIQANAHLPVVKGSKRHNFGEITPGERLRLRIALIVGLLRVGARTRTSRHPGLLIIDDLTGHEVNTANAGTMARNLADVAEETGLQVITASTYAPTLVNALGEASVVRPADGVDVMF